MKNLLKSLSIANKNAFDRIPTSHNAEQWLESASEAALDFGNGDGTFKSGENIKISYKIKNISKTTVKGTVGGSISDNDKKILHGFNKYIEIPAGQSETVSFTYQMKDPGVYSVYIRLRNSTGNLASQSGFVAYAPEKIPGTLTRKDDFDTFWEKSITELAKVKPDFQLKKNEKLSTKDYDMYLFEMKSLDNMTIRGWYRVPPKRQNLPVVLQLPSLGGNFYNIGSLDDKPKHGIPLDFAVLSLNIRGHGNSRDVIDVGDNYMEIISYHIEDINKYIYRGAVMDCIRAIDFLYTRPEIDKNKIVVEGASQGGALSLMTAALDNRVRLCAPDVPFLCDIESLFKITEWVEKEFKRYMTKHPGLSLWRVRQNLTYFDNKNFADKIKVPVFMGIGLQDWTCPAGTSIITYNMINSEKECIIYPYGKHDGGGALHRLRKFEWIRKQWE